MDAAAPARGALTTDYPRLLKSGKSPAMTSANEAPPIRPRRQRAPRKTPTPPAPPQDGTFTPLTTERLILRPLRPDDAESLHRLINDWEVSRTLSVVPFPYPRALADDWIASTARELESGSAYHLAITGQDGADELLVGVVGLRLDLKARRGRLGYWVGRRFWGHGVATEAAGRLARWALANLDLDRLEANVATDNPASVAVLHHIGFRETGRGTEKFVSRGGEHPVLRFEATRERPVRRLDPADPTRTRPPGRCCWSPPAR